MGRNNNRDGIKSLRLFRKWQTKDLQRENIPLFTAKEAMIDAVFLHPEDNVSTILNKLKGEDTTVCIVVDKEGKFRGEISDGNIITLFLHQVKYEPLTKSLNVGYLRNFRYKSAKELINKHKNTVYLDTPLNKVIELVYQKKFCYIPVIDHSRKVVGVVTPSSIIDLLRKH